MAASTLLHLLFPSGSNLQYSNPRPLPSLKSGPTRRRRFRAARCSTSSPVDLPLLPFQPAEVLIPSECKTLHLYEARYLALLEEMEPYLHGDVSPIMDESSEGVELNMRVSKLRECMCNLHSLQMKLRVPEDEPLQTNIKGSLVWSEKEMFEEYDPAFIPGLQERLSFAAYQTVSGMSDEELLTLQQYKMQAMDLTNTLERLKQGIEYLEHNIGMIAARLAIQNI